MHRIVASLGRLVRAHSAWAGLLALMLLATGGLALAAHATGATTVMPPARASAVDATTPSRGLDATSPGRTPGDGKAHQQRIKKRRISPLRVASATLAERAAAAVHWPPPAMPAPQSAGGPASIAHVRTGARPPHPADRWTPPGQAPPRA